MGSVISNIIFMYHELKKEVEEELEKAKREAIKLKLRDRLELLKKLVKRVSVLNKEITLLMESGEVTNLEDYIKIESDEDAHINLTMAKPIGRTVGIEVNK